MVVGHASPYGMLRNSLKADPQLEEVFGPQLAGQYAPARVEDVDALVSSFGRFATRSYDREIVSSVVQDAVRVTATLTPPVTNDALDPYQVLGLVLGKKAAGYHCNGSKYGFVSRYIYFIYYSLWHPTMLLDCIPLYVIIPKEEIRDVTKSPRDLAFPPTWFVLLTIMYEKLFFIDTLHNWMQSPIKVGIPLPQCWYLIVHWLTQYQRVGFITRYFMWDASQFDRSHPIEVTLTWHDLMRLKKAFNKLFEQDPHALTLAFINFWSCVRLVVLPDGRIVLVYAGIYSGDISTTNKNSYNHIIRLAICWASKFGSLKGFSTFMRVSGICLFGDDAVAAAHCQMHCDFLTDLPEHWTKTSGANLVVSSSKHLSKVSFLGRRALGDSLPHSLIPVTADMPRLISSLVFKNKPSQTALTRLSKLVAVRQLLCGFSFPDGTAPKSIIEANALGRENLNSLDLVIRDHIARHSAEFNYSPQWRALCFMGEMPQAQLLSSLLAGTDVPFSH